MIDFAFISPFTIAVDSITTGPSTSIFPFTAPAIYAEEPDTSPTTIVPSPIFTVPSLSIPPTSLGVLI